MFFEGMIKGLSVTFGHFVDSYRKRTGIDKNGQRSEEFSSSGLFTVQYPEEKLPMYPRFRGALMHLRDEETGDPNCTACNMCIRACPQDCLIVDGEGRGKERRATHFEYILSDCIFCRLCVEACNFDAIEMSPEYELATTEKVVVWDFEKLLEVGDKYDVHHTGEAWE